MLSNISLNNHIKELSITNNELNTVENVITANVTTSLSVNSEQKHSLLNQTIIVQLQEIHDYSILQVSAKKDEIDFNGTPRLEWLKDRNNDLYKEKVITLSNGFKMIENFKEILERNINSETISNKDWSLITLHIEGFKNGLANSREHRAKTNDPIIHKVLDCIMPKTQQRIDMLKQYLATKTKEPEIEFRLLDNFEVKENTIATINNSPVENTNSLFDFLIKDLKWYKWYLEDKEEYTTTHSLQFFQLTSSTNHIFISKI